MKPLISAWILPFLLISINSLLGQSAGRSVPRYFDLKQTADERSSPGGNFIEVITVHEDTAYVGSGNTLSITTNNGDNWIVFSSEDCFQLGGWLFERHYFSDQLVERQVVSFDDL